ncbi:Curlin associated protein [Salinibacter ruber]|jgi:hypothetical protein|uniref:Curlin associated protein n=1 Tax=Salinibacter ruber TaxID=146919 RepID=UPI0021695AB3|nr:Curlin associated protein [Salinibacter ruber]MCS3698422.1 hypothetical protein [Salinibacter ruber]
MRQLLRTTATFALALVFSAGMAFGQTNNEADLSQTSSESRATITQSGDNFTELKQQSTSKATVTQTGAGNEVDQFVQKSGVNKNRGGGNFINLANIDQIGDENTVASRYDALETQSGNFGGGAKLILDQFGDKNDLKIVQNGRASATIKQSNSGGNSREGNTAKVDQNPLNSSGSTLELVQVGLENESVINQNASSGAGNFANIDVAGVNNEVDVDQGDPRSGLASASNDLYLNMQDARGTAGGGQRYNTVDIDQNGGDGTVDAGISGRVNTITVTQSGSGNLVDGTTSGIGQADGLYVEGDFNTVTVTQSSANNTADVEVVGSNNNTTITQQSN